MRNFKGYGNNPPHPKWPENAKIAVQFVVNYEEGAENCVLDGDQGSETFLSEIIGASPHIGQRHMNMESIYEYGSRSGFWRLLNIFKKNNFPVTVFGVAMALEKNPIVVDAIQEMDWELASHGYRWIDYKDISAEEERQHIKKAIDIHKTLTGSVPSGWYVGRTSPNTRNILLDEVPEILYDSDSYADDLPYWVEGRKNKHHLIIPYTLDVNDMRFASFQGFNSGEQFFQYCKDAFDVLYEEGNQSPKMMSIGLHCRLIGRPGRTAALLKFLNYIKNKERVWVCKRIDIAHHWYEFHSLE